MITMNTDNWWKDWAALTCTSNYCVRIFYFETTDWVTHFTQGGDDSKPAKFHDAHQEALLHHNVIEPTRFRKDDEPFLLNLIFP